MKIKNKKGFTLVELIVVMALTPFIIMIIHNAILTGYKLLHNAGKKATVHEQAKSYLNTMAFQLKNCRDYMQTKDIDTGGKYESLFSGFPGKKICYIEGYDNKRLLYTLVTEADGTKQVYVYTFSDAVNDKYDFVEDENGNKIYSTLTKNDYNKFNGVLEDGSTYNEYKAYKSTEDIDNRVGDVSGFSKKFFFYDTYEWKMYLIVGDETDSDHSKWEYRKYLLTPKLNESFTLSTPKVIMKYSDVVTITKDLDYDDVKKKCQIYIKAKYGNIEKELKTDVYIFQRI